MFSRLQSTKAHLGRVIFCQNLPHAVYLECHKSKINSLPLMKKVSRTDTIPVQNCSYNKRNYIQDHTILKKTQSNQPARVEENKITVCPLASASRGHEFSARPKQPDKLAKRHSNYNILIPTHHMGLRSVPQFEVVLPGTNKKIFTAYVHSLRFGIIKTYE